MCATDLIVNVHLGIRKGNRTHFTTRRDTIMTFYTLQLLHQAYRFTSKSLGSEHCDAKFPVLHYGKWGLFPVPLFSAQVGSRMMLTANRPLESTQHSFHWLNQTSQVSAVTPHRQGGKSIMKLDENFEE